MRLLRTFVAFAVGGALGATARAQAPVNEPPVGAQPQPPPQQPYVAPVPEPQPQLPPPPRRKQHESAWYSFSPTQTTFTVGAGVADYSFSSMRAATEVGAAWDARLTFGTRSLLAFEAGYAGTYNKMESPVEGASAVAPYIVNNSVDTDLRVNLLPFRFQPYVFGGVGYNHASVNNLADNPGMAARFRASDDNLLVPAGGGFAVYLGRHATVDARATYRAIFENRLDRFNPNARADQWVVNGRVGVAF
jgi:hypothetical protein